MCGLWVAGRGEALAGHCMSRSTGLGCLGGTARGGGGVVNTAKSQRARRRAEQARLTRALARLRAADPALQARRAGVAAQHRRLRRALETREAAVELVSDADRRTAEAIARLVELGEPVARVAARVGLPAAALRKTLRTHLPSAAADNQTASASQQGSEHVGDVHEDG